VFWVALRISSSSIHCLEVWGSWRRGSPVDLKLQQLVSKALWLLLLPLPIGSMKPTFTHEKCRQIKNKVAQRKCHFRRECGEGHWSPCCQSSSWHLLDSHSLLPTASGSACWVRSTRPPTRRSGRCTTSRRTHKMPWAPWMWGWLIPCVLPIAPIGKSGCDSAEGISDLQSPPALSASGPLSSFLGHEMILGCVLTPGQSQASFFVPSFTPSRSLALWVSLGCWGRLWKPNLNN